ncbi:hypothetical protein [Isoptericola aurantiacus]|uniref:hypothetical protein n=1 Tax=Isoptericola aurantiacus TaxID=3377839 RepID=UPI00383BDD24
MPVPHRAARALLAGVLGCGTLVCGAGAAVADDDDLTVTSDGVSYSGRDDDRDRWDRVGYSIRSLEGWQFEWLTEPMGRGRAGHVSFTEATAVMPDGYCVVYVTVPGVGDWSAEGAGPQCTGSPSDGATPSPDDTAASSPTPSADPTPHRTRRPSPSPSATASATPEPAETAAAEPTPTPTPSASPSPSPSASPSPSPSPSATPSPKASPTPPRTAAAGSGDEDAVGAAPVSLDDTGGSPQDAIFHGDTWAAVGLVLAAAGLTAGGVVAWRARRPVG